MTLDEVVREEWGRLVSLLLARYRRLDLVEDALADAVEVAATRWPRDGQPDNPSAWLLTTARRRIIDRMRAETMAQRKLPMLIAEQPVTMPVRADPGGLVEDELLRLSLMCSHPALAPESASALTLRLVLGVSTHDIARLFLVPEPTMAARLTRAKKKIVAAGIPFAVPDATVLPDRLDTLAQTAYLAFTAGYAPASGPGLLRAELAGEAIRLMRAVLDGRDGEPVLTALLALMLLQHSRRDARTGPDGGLVLLADQDRTTWHHDEIAEALRLLRTPSLTGPITVQAATYLVQARIAAAHATAPTAEETGWPAIVRLYDTLLGFADSPSARLARAVAVAEADGPEAGLAALAEVDIPGSHRVPAARAELLRRAGEGTQARAAYAQAIELCRNDAERAHLAGRAESLA